MGAILEDVDQRHRGGGEAMNEEGLKFALDKVQGDEGDGEGLECGGRRQAGVKHGVDENRPEVFDQEDGAPGDLGAWMFGGVESG